MRRPAAVAIFPFFAAVAVDLIACDVESGLVDETYPGKALHTFTGTLTAPSNAEIAGPVSLAILWIPRDFSVDGPDLPDILKLAPQGGPCTGEPWPLQVKTETKAPTVSWVTQPVTYDAEFPIQFQVPVTAPPPEEAHIGLGALGGSGVGAWGFLIAFSDENQNGTFDLSSPGKEVDTRLAVSKEWIVYLDGVDPPAPDFVERSGSLQPGFNILVEEGSVDIAPDGASGFGTVKETVYAPGTPIRMEIATEGFEKDRVNLIGCAAEEFRLEFGGKPPEEAMTFCSPDGRSYEWNADDGLKSEPCRSIFRYGGACLEEGVPIPADWPCVPPS